MATKLKPCPFCGGEVTLGTPCGGYAVECFNSSCKIRLRTHYSDDKEITIKRWNKRVEK